MKSLKFTETMIGSKDMARTAEFYKKFLSMEVAHPGDGESFMILKDAKTNQALCIVADPSIEQAQPSLEAEDLEHSMAALESLGGKVLSVKTYSTMKFANVEDVDGRKMCIWQLLENSKG